jgi:hypothetical protein
MTDKPEVVCWGSFYKGVIQDFGYNEKATTDNARLDFHGRELTIEPLIRLTDHEAARAADKARIAALEAEKAGRQQAVPSVCPRCLGKGSYPGVYGKHACNCSAPAERVEQEAAVLAVQPAMNEHEEMKNAMQLAQGPKPTTLGQLHDYLDSIRKAWSAQDTKYLGSYESQPLYILPNDPTPGFQLAEAKYFAEFGLTFIPVEGASK